MTRASRKLGEWDLLHTAGGAPVHVWKRRVLPIDQHFIDCVFYLYPSVEEAREGSLSGGTGFFVSVESKYTSMAYVYAVTCKHVIVGEKTKRPAPIIRLTLRDGKPDVLPTGSLHWVSHSKDDVSAAFLGIIDLQSADFTAIPSDRLLTVEQTHNRMKAIRPGVQCFMVGRFMGDDGKRRNSPTVRLGHLAKMPAQLMEHPAVHMQQSFLVEMHTIGGFSGSPVFIHVGHFSSGITKLLGVDWGHLPMEEKVMVRTKGKHGSSKPLSDNGTETYVVTNSAMSVVVPAWKLWELLDGRVLGGTRRNEEQRMAEAENHPKVVLDSADERPTRGLPPDRLKIDGTFEDAARKLTRTPRPEGGLPKPSAHKRKPKG